MPGIPYVGGETVNGREVLLSIYDTIDTPDNTYDSIVALEHTIVGDGGTINVTFSSGLVYKITVEQA